jgi:ABC-type branched-subunit amino acid transport system substrate-binding protein
MSHLVTIRTQVRDPTALQAACRRLGLKAPVQGTARLYTTEATGQIVELPGWTYPVVIDTSTGQIQYDNYQGAWGDQALLGRLMQAYAAEKARLEARKTGYQVTEQTLPDGSLRLTLQEMGGAI